LSGFIDRSVLSLDKLLLMLQFKADVLNQMRSKLLLTSTMLRRPLKAAAEKRMLHQDTIGSPNLFCLQNANKWWPENVCFVQP
jgi:hypothetical protein